MVDFNFKMVGFSFKMVGSSLKMDDFWLKIADFNFHMPNKKPALAHAGASHLKFRV